MIKALDRTSYKDSLVNCDIVLPYRTPLLSRDCMVYVNDALWICGGDTHAPNYQDVANCGKLNLLTKEFEYMPSMSASRTWFNMVHVGGKIYALMGYSNFVVTVTNEVFDIATETWSPLPDFPTVSGRST
jgi:hypothetical protein